MAAFWSLAVGISCFKALLLPAYKSTDFDVHRNWLAITHSLPVRKWYYEATSEWTLDYPPLFAWFEYLLSQVAVLFDPEMLKVENINYSSYATIVFQRLSVIVTDLVFIYAVKEFYKSRSSSKTAVEKEDILHSPSLVLAVILLCNFGLLVVDHIHFQYNGFLYGILLLSIVRMYQGRNMSAAFWFAALLNFKHIYLYIAPAYFIYLLRCYVFQSNEDNSLRWRSFSILRLIGLGVVVIGVFSLSLGPFVVLKCFLNIPIPTTYPSTVLRKSQERSVHQLPQLVTRLFPFKRGLCHAYWAPNFWAMYNIMDKVCSVAGVKLGLIGVSNETATMTGGLVQEFQHTVLPSISPLVTLVLSLLSMLPSLLLLWSRPKGVQSFLRVLILCGFGSFMFGWHVHEKAVLMITIPLSLLAADKKKDAQVFLIMSTVGHYSLFPLLFTQFESPIKICLLVLTSLYSFTSLSNIHRERWSWSSLPLLSTIESLYLLGIVPLEMYNSLGHSLLGLGDKLPFLPLLLTSVYCSIGVIYCWLKFYWLTYCDKPKYGKQQ